jgi:K+-transporting ATPase ATPase A chain
MTLIGWAQIALVLVLVIATAVPLGRYTAAVAAGRVGFPAPVETGFYRTAGIDPSSGMGWRDYGLAMLALNAAGFVWLYILLRLQGVLPLNPQGLPGLDPWLAFNTAISFVTNTNWQAYSGEAAMSYLSQMAGLRCRTSCPQRPESRWRWRLRVPSRQAG